jgi:alkylation response protein AidB-like acyl-CoA dehydrogenase
MDTPGIALEPMYNIAGGRQNQVFLKDVRVPDRMMLGGLNQGWTQIWFGLGGDPIPTFEDNDPGPEVEYDPPLIGLPWVFDQLVQYCRTTIRNGAPLSDDCVVRTQLADLATGVEIEKMKGYDPGSRYGVHMQQAIWKEFQPRFAQTCMEILGPLGLIQAGRWAPLAGEIDRIYRRSFGNHAGGTSQVKRMVVATRVLGLSR